MEPTLKNGNTALIKKYNLDLKYNDIVVVKKDNKIIIKRLVGFPGDTIRSDNYLYVNDKKMMTYTLKIKERLLKKLL